MTGRPGFEPTTFGNYTLLRRIAMGGTAEIYLARRHGVDGFARHLAIKRILPHLADDKEFVQLLLDEARLAAHLHHGHIIEIHEVGVEDEQAYIAMEYCPGADVGRLLRAARKRRRRVLVVHPDAATRAALGDAIGKLAVEVALASGPVEAEARSAEGAVDLAVIAAELLGPIRDPLIHGLQTRHPELLRTVILGETEGRGHGIYAFVQHELRPEAVVRAVKRCLAPALPLELAVQIVRAVADGLDHAHNATDYDGRPLRIVHRDVNPSNVLISMSGTAKLVDFGIARAATSAKQRDSGNFVGTYRYMSPEQASGADADARSDLFSLGTLLYELVTGNNPFAGDNEFATMRAIKEDEPAPIGALVPGLPEAVAKIVRRAGAKERNARYASAEEMLADLEDLVRREGLNLSPKRLAGFMEVTFGKKTLGSFGVGGTGYHPVRPAETPAPRAARAQVSSPPSAATVASSRPDKSPAPAPPPPARDRVSVPPRASRPPPPAEVEVDLGDLSLEIDESGAALGVLGGLSARRHPVDEDDLGGLDAAPRWRRGDGAVKVLLTLFIVALLAMAGWYWHWRSTQSAGTGDAARVIDQSPTPS